MKIKHIYPDMAQVPMKTVSPDSLCQQSDAKRSIQVKNWLLRTFVGVCLFSLAVVQVFAQHSIILDSDSAKLFEGFGQYFVSPGQAENLQAKGQIPEGEAVFKIVKVSNIQGNNPFNQVQPVYNFGGVVVSNADDLIDCVRGGICKGSSGGGFACTPSSAKGGPSAELCMKSATSCGVYGGGCLTGIEGFYSYYCDAGFCAGYRLYVRGSNGYVLSGIQPNAAPGPEGRFINLVSGQRYTMKMTQGVKAWLVSFSSTVNPDKSVTLRVYSVTSL